METAAGNLSAGRTWGLGVRFPTPFLSFLPGSVATDAAGSPVALLRFWLTPLLAVEGGGWLSGYSDPWSESSFLLLTGGLLLKVVDAERGDLYLAGRGLHARRASREKGVFFGEPPATTPSAPSQENENVPPCCPPRESESFTLALELAAGAEWSLSPQLAVEFELGAAYAQTATTSSWPFRPAPPEEPVPLALGLQMFGEETYTSVSWGITLRLGVSFYFLSSRGGAEELGEEGG